MGVLYTAPPREYVRTRVVSGWSQLQPTFAPTIKSILLTEVENSLDRFQDLCILGRSKDPLDFQRALGTLAGQRAQVYIDSAPARDGSIQDLVMMAFKIWIDIISVTPVDLSGRINAGTVLQQLGNIPWADGSLQLAGFPPGPNA